MFFNETKGEITWGCYIATWWERDMRNSLYDTSALLCEVKSAFKSKGRIFVQSLLTLKSTCYHIFNTNPDKALVRQTVFAQLLPIPIDFCHQVAVLQPVSLYLFFCLHSHNNLLAAVLCWAFSDAFATCMLLLEQTLTSLPANNM